MNERDKELADQVQWSVDVTYGELQKFADLIRADERERIKVANAPEIDRINTHIKNLEDAVKNEREACAVMADECANIEELGAAIRARGNT